MLTSPADCLRRAALAEEFAARVDFEMAQERLIELAAWWRSQALILSEEMRSFQDSDDAPPGGGLDGEATEADRTGRPMRSEGQSPT